MAKATATCTCKTCGKSFEVSAVKQNRREADRWAEWAGKTYDECSECYKERLARERAEENKRAAEVSAERKWPVLQGSEKQVAWANTIRMVYISRLEETLAGCEEGGERAKGLITMRDFILETYTDARFWIDNRDDYYAIRRQASKDYIAKNGGESK